MNTETECVAVPESLPETALVAQDQLGKCGESNKYKNGEKIMATETSDASGLAVLYFGNVFYGLELCDKEVVTLLNGKAANLCYGIWLLNSASGNFKFRESDMNATSAAGSLTIDGCRIRLLSLNCGNPLVRLNVSIRSDVSTSLNVPTWKVNVTLPEPMA